MVRRRRSIFLVARIVLVSALDESVLGSFVLTGRWIETIVPLKSGLILELLVKRPALISQLANTMNG